MLPFFEEALGVIRALEHLNITYMVVGSLAMSLHGVARATRDADIVAALRKGDGAHIAAELGGHYYIDVADAEEAILHGRSFNIIYTPKSFKIDVFAARPGAYDAEALRRRLTVPLEDEARTAVAVSAAEDVVLAKLRWYRAGGEASDQQWRDILGVLRLQGSRLDFEYLHHWASKESVRVLLERAIAEAESSG